MRARVRRGAPFAVRKRPFQPIGVSINSCRGTPIPALIPLYIVASNDHWRLRGIRR